MSANNEYIGEPSQDIGNTEHATDDVRRTAVAAMFAFRRYVTWWLTGVASVWLIGILWFVIYTLVLLTPDEVQKMWPVIAMVSAISVALIITFGVVVSRLVNPENANHGKGSGPIGVLRSADSDTIPPGSGS